MRINKVVSKLNSGNTPIGITMKVPSTSLVEMLGTVGFDFVLFDAEHGPFTVDLIDDLCMVADSVGLTPLARVPDIPAPTIILFLDRGIMGIMGPHISSQAKAKQLADACRYVPEGHRSLGSGRGSYYGRNESTTEYMAHTNSQILVIAQLEDVAVLDEIDGILSVDGIDLFNSGAQDIAQSFGLPGQPTHPKVQEFQKTVRDAVNRAGKQMAEDATINIRIDDLILDAAEEAFSAAKLSAN